jgi:UDP-glucuronate 4-epimerase
MTILVTGAAGFIGFHTATALLARGETVAGVDNLNAYYDVRLKEARLAQLKAHPRFRFIRADFADRPAMKALFEEVRPDRVVHLGAQAGVRYSIENPEAYIDSNLVGFLAILEGCRHTGVKHLVYASSSSVYGANAAIPFAEDRSSTDHPVSLYAATKRSNELMAHTYAHLYGLPVTGLRFFTVYGPWGRPDMAYFKFTKAMLAGETIDVFNNGQHARDFTYIDDIVTGVVNTLDRPAHGVADGTVLTPATSAAPFRVYNIGNNKPVELLDMIAILERLLGIKARTRMLPMQMGDVHTTFANVDALMRDTGFSPSTPIEQGLAQFVSWYRTFEKC